MAKHILEDLAPLIDTDETATMRDDRLRYEADMKAIRSEFPDIAFGEDGDLLGDDDMGDDDMGDDELGDDLGEDELGEDELGEDEGDEMGSDEEMGAVAFVPGMPIPVPIPPRALYMRGTKIITRRIRRGLESKKRTQRQIKRLRKIWATLSKSKRGLRTAGLMNPDQVIAAARSAPPLGHRPHAAAPHAASPAAASAPSAPKAAEVPPLSPTQAAQVQAQASTSNAVRRTTEAVHGPYDTRVPPHQRRGYEALAGSGKLITLFRTFPTSELQIIRSQPHRGEHVHRVAAVVLGERRGAAGRPAARPSAPPPAHAAAAFIPSSVPTPPTLVQAPTPAFRPTGYTPVSRAMTSANPYARRRFGEDDFGGTPGYEEVPTYWTAVGSHPVKFALVGATLFGLGAYFADPVKGYVSDLYGRATGSVKGRIRRYVS